MPESSRKQQPPFVSSSVVLLASLLGVGILSLVSRTEHPGRFLLARAHGGRFVEIGDGVLQTTTNDCGPAALAHCLRALGEEVRYPDSTWQVDLTERGCRLDALAQEAVRRGWTARFHRLRPQEIHRVSPPAILHSREGHFLVFERMGRDGRVVLHDPALGRITHSRRSLARRWTGHVLEFVANASPDGTDPGPPAGAAPPDAPVCRAEGAW